MGAYNRLDDVVGAIRKTTDQLQNGGAELEKRRRHVEDSLDRITRIAATAVERGEQIVVRLSA